MRVFKFHDKYSYSPLQCFSCLAPLDVGLDRNGIVQCEYCGTVWHVGEWHCEQVGVTRGGPVMVTPTASGVIYDWPSASSSGVIYDYDWPSASSMGL